MAFEVTAEAVALRSPYPMDSIEAKIRLPSDIDHHGGYVLFYVGFGDEIEAGVSYSLKWKGWNRFINNSGVQTDGHAGPLHLGGVATLSLARVKGGRVNFSVNGDPIGHGYLAQPAIVKMVMAVLLSAGSSFSEAVFKLLTPEGPSPWQLAHPLGKQVTTGRIKVLTQTTGHFSARMP